MASLEPKLFCSVARASGFVLCALASACLSNRRRELLRYNNVKRLVRINISRATPPHRRTSCSVTQGEFRPGSETGDYTGRAISVSSAGPGCPCRSKSKKPSQEVHYSSDNTPDDKQKQNNSTKYH